MTRRRLELLPEKLPAPPPRSDGGPRQRALASLSRLAAVAAAAATIGGCKDKGGPIGFGVVDPMPAPAKCNGLATSIHVTAHWKDADTIEVVLAKPGMVGARYSSEKPDVSGGRLVAAEIKPETASVRVKPEVESIAVRIEATCPAGPESVLVTVTIAPGDAGTDAGRALSLRIVDEAR